MSAERASYAVFLSYAREDVEIARRIYNWLNGTAGLNVWMDEVSLPPGKPISAAISLGIPQCRNFLALISAKAVSSRWCPGEWKAALRHQERTEGFELISLRIDETDMPVELDGSRYLEAPGGRLTIQDSAQLLATITDAKYDHRTRPRNDIYLARPWSGPSGIGLAEFVTQKASEFGFRLIQDAKDQKHYDEATRVRTIMESCGGLVAVVPNRGNGETSKYILREISLAQELGLAVLVVADSGVAAAHQTCIGGSELADNIMSQKIAARALTVDQEHFADPDFAIALQSRLEDFAENWQQPKRPHQMFLAASLNDGWDNQKMAGVQLITQVLASPCVIGDKITGDGTQKQIIDSIRQSVAMVADVTESNLNTCIEAGIARGSGQPVLHLIARGSRKRPDIFMFRDMEVTYYEDEMDYLAVLYRIARNYRRSVVNW